MHPTVKAMLAILAGALAGSVVNMGIVMISSSIIPPPAGADFSTMEGLKASMHLMQPKHFLLPFLAHALGTFTGALLAAKISSNQKIRLAMVIGIFFLIGGIANVFMIPSPAWFNALDLMVAYIPMAYMAGKLVERK
jgi:hypothetical protein